MFKAHEETWNSGIMQRWQLALPDQPPRRSEYSRQAVVRYNGTGDQGWLTVYPRKISRAREIEDIQRVLEKLDARTSHAHQEHLVDYAIDILDRPIFPLRLGAGLYTVSEPVGMYSLTDYYKWHNRAMRWPELIAVTKSMAPAVAALHREGISHGNIAAENIFLNAGSSDLQQVALEEVLLVLGCPYPFPQTLEFFPCTAAALLMRTPQQIDCQRFGRPDPRSDIRQLATLLSRILTGFWPFEISKTPSLREIIDAICDEKKLRLDRLPEPLSSVFARALSTDACQATVETFGRETVEAAQECQEAAKRALRTGSSGREGVSRRRVIQALAATTTLTLIVAVTIGVKSLQDGTHSHQPAPPPALSAEPLNQLGNQLATVVPLSGKAFIAGNVTGQLALYALGRQRPLRTLQLSTTSLSGMALSAAGRALVCYSRNGYVSQLDGQLTAKAGKQARLSQDAHALALLGSGVLISDGALVHFFAGALEKPWSTHLSAGRQYQGHAAMVTCLATVSDDRVVSSSIDKTVQMWNAFSGEMLCTYTQHTSEVRAVAATVGSGALLLASGDRVGAVHIWIPQGQGVYIAGYQHTGAVNALAWSNDGRYLLSGGEDGLLALYDGKTGQVSRRYTRRREPVRAVAWLSNGFVVTMSADELHIWQLGQSE
jgi:hypothetical protein